MLRRDLASTVLRLAVLPSWLLLGCQTVPQPTGRLEREFANSHLSAHQVRVMVNEFVLYFADRVERRADEMLAETTDPGIRQNALRWKINAISACFQAASRPDPLGAYLDVWILNRQMTDFFDSPAGVDLFGPWQTIPRDECQVLLTRLQQIHDAVGGDLRLGEDFVWTFADNYPLTSIYFDREPMASGYIEDVREPAHELFQVIANVDDNLDELKKLSVLYAEHLPKQARWEAQLLLIDVTQQPIVQQPLEKVSQIATAVERVSRTTDQLPDLVLRERHALRQIVADERTATLAEFDHMRQDTMTELARERAIVLDALRTERHAVLETLHDERVAVSQQLSAEVSKTLQATDVITRQRADQLTRQVPQLVDHFFWRALQLCAAVALGVVAGVVLMRRAKSKSAEPLVVRHSPPTDDRRKAA